MRFLPFSPRSRKEPSFSSYIFRDPDSLSRQEIFASISSVIAIETGYLLYLLQGLPQRNNNTQNEFMMQLEKILVLLSIAAYGAAENDVEASDVPSECLPACQFTIDLSARCDRETDDDDTYTPCVCNAQDSMQRLTECASCVKDHGRSDPDDNDVADLMDDCGWDFNDADGPCK
ncbi:hypothetical protein NPX13_g2735 [Xylaria arbuscula]|uniref:Uncharacterized protein n=1 Tax=Xylaria arbuscula TaxID=114810 RepID=A0A9W8NJI6_9PEZI|nr:hypothetical protein NPX13_g2735 [Xylaria arbuscula]